MNGNLCYESRAVTHFLPAALRHHQRILLKCNQITAGRSCARCSLSGRWRHRLSSLLTTRIDETLPSLLLTCSQQSVFNLVFVLFVFFLLRPVVHPLLFISASTFTPSVFFLASVLFIKNVPVQLLSADRGSNRVVSFGRHASK